MLLLSPISLYLRPYLYDNGESEIFSKGYLLHWTTEVRNHCHTYVLLFQPSTSAWREDKQWWTWELLSCCTLSLLVLICFSKCKICHWHVMSVTREDTWRVRLPSYCSYSPHCRGSWTDMQVHRYFCDGSLQKWHCQQLTKHANSFCGPM